MERPQSCSSRAYPLRAGHFDAQSGVKCLGQRVRAPPVADHKAAPDLFAAHNFFQ